MDKLRFLQMDDPEFAPFFWVYQYLGDLANREYTSDFRDPEIVFRMLTRKHHLSPHRANQVLREVQYYEIDERGLLVRVKYDPGEDSATRRTVIPAGGIPLADPSGGTGGNGGLRWWKAQLPRLLGPTHGPSRVLLAVPPG